MENKPVTEEDFGFREKYVYPKVQSAKRLLKQKVNDAIDKLQRALDTGPVLCEGDMNIFITEISEAVDTCLDIPDGED